MKFCFCDYTSLCEVCEILLDYYFLCEDCFFITFLVFFAVFDKNRFIFFLMFIFTVHVTGDQSVQYLLLY